MILWCDGAHGAAENMRRDARLLDRLEASGDASPADGEPVLRLFQFARPAITLGMSQRPERTLDLLRCRADGVEWAVRPTGGRAIFHAEEWTYSFAARIGDPAWGGDRQVAFERVSSVVLESLRRLSVPAVRSSAGSTDEASPSALCPTREPADRVSCFATTARHEILLAGAKLVGSAQRRTARALLQQGSVLLGPGHTRLADYLRLEPGERERARRRLASSAASAGEALGGDRTLARWSDALARSLPIAPLRLCGASGLALLTLEESDSHTAAARN